MYSIGKAIASVVFLSVLVLLKKSIWHIWNLFFVISIALSLLAVFEPQIGMSGAKHLFIGLSELGWPAALYMLACAQRRFASYKLLKQCTFVFVALAPFTTISDDFAEMLFPEYIPIIALVYVLVITIGILMASPFSFKHLFSSVWIDDLHKPDMVLWMDKVDDVDTLEHLGLTSREREVVALLLEGYTARMIAGELHIAEGTVNLHTKHLYRKLNINSRMELFARFGVRAAVEKAE
jgi:DNA-binding CsgD family transcriptional regulator